MGILGSVLMRFGGTFEAMCRSFKCILTKALRTMMLALNGCFQQRGGTAWSLVIPNVFSFGVQSVVWRLHTVVDFDLLMAQITLSDLLQLHVLVLTWFYYTVLTRQLYTFLGPQSLPPSSNGAKWSMLKAERGFIPNCTRNFKFQAKWWES